MKTKLLAILLLLSLLVSVIAGCTGPDIPEESTVSTEAPSEEKSDNTEKPTESQANNTTEPIGSESREETTAPTEIETETQKPLPSIDELNNNAYGEAYYMMETYTNTSASGLPSGWHYDNRFDLTNKTGYDSYKISDNADDQYFAFTRDFDPESEGILRLELLLGFASKNGGAYITFVSSNGERIVTVTERDGYFVLIGSSTVVSDISVPKAGETQHSFTIDVDLDKNTAKAIINNTYIGEVEIAADAVISRVALGTETEGTGNISLLYAELNKNYPLSDRFIIPGNKTGEKPAGWNVTGDFKLEYIASEYYAYHSVYSIKADSVAGSVSTASKSFDKMFGKFTFETYILLPEKADGASVALTSGESAILKFETKDGNIVMGDTVLHDYAANVWQCLHIDGDTETGIATVYINGKKRAEISFTAESFDGVNISFAPNKNAVMWFDDVVLYNLFDYADYPAYPQVAESTDYNVGVNVCWLWRDSNSGEGWDAASGFPELYPYIGYYDEGLRETADWELKYMAEHGIDFMNVCWYSPGHDVTDPIKKMYRSYSALHDGYMYAKYSDLVKFCLLWENDTRGFTNFEQFKNIAWAYWKEYYFSDDRYMRLDNKALITVWSKELLITMFGGEQEFADAVKFMEEELIEMGYDGLILLFTTQGKETQGTYSKYLELGYDGSYAYHFGPGGYNPQTQIDINRQNTSNASSASAYHMPTISVGFNSLPRHGERYPLISAEDHLKVCEDVKDLLATFNTGTWMDNTVMISTWNEFTEGTYIFPTEGIGFSYLESIRKAFTNDTSDHSKIDTKPTEAQIERVSHMYPDNYSLIRWQKTEVSDEEREQDMISTYVPVLTMDMSKRSDASLWQASHGLAGVSAGGGALKGSSTSNDYGVKVKLPEKIDTATTQILHIRMKTSAAGSLEVFFATKETQDWDGTRRVSTSIKAPGETCDYYLVMSDNSNWAGSVTNIRIDPCDNAGSFVIELVEFMRYPDMDMNKPSVMINHSLIDFRFDPVVLSDRDFEIVAEPDRGFFSLMLVDHTWDRFNGVLTLKSRSGRTLIFTVGSDKVIVDGTEEELGYTFTLRDGLPVFRIKKLCNLLKYKFSSKGRRIEIQSCSDAEYEALVTQTDGLWQFNTKDIDGWSGQNAAITIDGNGTLTCTPANSDPSLIRQTSFDASEYNMVEVGLKYFEGLESMDAVFYFLTTSNYTWDENKAVHARYEIPEDVEEGDTVKVVFDLFYCASWVGGISYVRIDTIAGEMVHEIDYIKFYNEDTEGLEKPVEGEWEFNKADFSDNWLPQNGSFEIDGNGTLIFTPTNADSALYKQVSFDASKYTKAVVGVKYFEGLDEGAYFFFLPPNDYAWGDSRAVKANYVIPSGVKEGDIVYVTFDLSSCSNWTGTIAFIRFDLITSTSAFEVDSIKLLSN